MNYNIPTLEEVKKFDKEYVLKMPLHYYKENYDYGSHL